MQIKKIVVEMLAYLVLCYAIIGMAFAIAQYFSFKTDIAFLQFKQAYLSNQTWLFAFYIHVFTSIFVLLAGLSQFSNFMLKNYRSLHKLIGKIYVIDILFVNFPFAMIMAIYANGGLPSKIAFATLDLLWFYFTLMAFLAVKNKDFKKHKEYMIRSYALTFSAITLRTWKYVFTHTTNLDVNIIYMIDAWLGFLPNLIVAEIIIRKPFIFQKKY